MVNGFLIRKVLHILYYSLLDKFFTIYCLYCYRCIHITQNSSPFSIFILSTVFIVCLQFCLQIISFWQPVCLSVCLSVGVLLSGPLVLQQTTQTHCDSQSVCLSLYPPVHICLYACLLLFACVCLFVPNSECLFFCRLDKYPIYLLVCLSVNVSSCFLFVF